MAQEEFSKYERARIVGARGLQIAMDAPMLLKMTEEEMNGVNFDPLKLAEKELDSGVLPISVKRPLPTKHEEEELTEIESLEEPTSDEEKVEDEIKEEKEIEEGGEIMELVANPEEDDETESPITAASELE